MARSIRYVGGFALLLFLGVTLVTSSRSEDRYAEEIKKRLKEYEDAGEIAVPRLLEKKEGKWLFPKEPLAPEAVKFQYPALAPATSERPLASFTAQLRDAVRNDLQTRPVATRAQLLEFARILDGERATVKQSDTVNASLSRIGRARQQQELLGVRKTYDAIKGHIESRFPNNLTAELGQQLEPYRSLLQEIAAALREVERE